MQYKVDEITEIAPTVHHVLLSPQGQILGFRPGQYLNIRVSDDLTLSYSLACAPRKDNKMEFFIRRIADDADNDAIFSVLKAGAELDIVGVAGKCVYQDTLNLPIIFVTAGVGIAQVKSIVEQAIRQQDKRDMHLFWAMPTEEDFFLYQEIEHWQQQLSMQVSRITRITGGLVETAVTEDYPQLYDYQAYICGASQMVDAVAKRLFGCGLKQEHCYSDRFE